MNIADVLSQMYAAGNDSVIIVEDQKPIGILTTKDVVSLIKHKSDLNKPIKKYMTALLRVFIKEQVCVKHLNLSN
ncbi:MAG: hypothetical protein IE887_08420 [Campylobacterales bacterium]|nr:hypothetical protein [Campylobacterales bacterium]